jgi:alpha-glucosidase
MLMTRLLLSLCLLTLPVLAAAEQGWQSLGSVTAVMEHPHGVDLTAGPGRLSVTALSSKVLRIRYSATADFTAEDPFAVLPDALGQAPKTLVEQSTAYVLLDAGILKVRMEKSPLRLIFLNPAGEVISQDQPGFPVAFNGPAFRVWKSMPEDEHYFALGDKAGPLDHRGQAFSMWNTDAFGWEESTDPLYKAIPFLLAVRHGAAYGLFLDDTYRTTFDLGKEARDAYSFGSDGGPLDYYFLYGPTPKDVVEQFTALTGRTPLPPLFALGYQQCRYSYYPEARVREVAGEFRKRHIPADVIYLDIDYQDKNRPFTIDPERFPHFDGMIKDLKDEGFKVVAITDLHLAELPGYRPYDEGLAGDFFVKNPDGSLYIGEVWPGPAVFPDFTRAAARDWWGTLYADFVSKGLRGFWNDMNEPAIFKTASKTMPLDVVHSFEGRKTDHREAHNVFGMENARATYEGLLKLSPGRRPFVLTRAAFAGAQRYAATWTGDNSSTWNHMRLSVPQLVNLGLSGYAFVGDDIGGFNGSPTPELLTRWMELGAFNPIFRNHAMKGSRDREPWVDGPENEAIRRRYIETRYRLLPYLYTSMEETSRTGVPLMRAMFMEFPNDESLATEGDEFMFGPSLLVAPKLREFAAPYEVHLPKGDWYDYWTGTKVPGGASVSVDPALDAVPVYARGGAIIPEQPLVQNSDEIPQGPLTLRVYQGPDCHGELYTDDGETLAYRHRDFLRVHLNCEATANQIKVTMSAPEGDFKPWFKEIEIKVFGLNAPPRSATIDGNAADIKTEKDTVSLPPFRWGGAWHEARILL